MPSSAQTKFSIIGKTPITLPFELIDNRVFVEVFLDGRGPLHFILDTGAGSFSLTDTAAQRLGLHVIESGQGPGVGENTVRVGKTHIAKLRLSGLRFEDVDASVLPGGDSGKVFGKNSRHQLAFEKNRQYGRRDSYDRAGLWMGQDGDRFTVVDVIAGGPAAQAGVQQGESILAIDGISASKLVLPDVRERIRRAKVGTKTTLLVASKGKQRRVTIVLRDLV